MDIIFDIDGTLYDHNHRLKYLFSDPPDWERFKSDIHLDTKISEINDLLIVDKKIVPPIFNFDINFSKVI